MKRYIVAFKLSLGPGQFHLVEIWLLKQYCQNELLSHKSSNLELNLKFFLK